eukprot:6038797-Pyramimonas_sp.AAC.1
MFMHYALCLCEAAPIGPRASDWAANGARASRATANETPRSATVTHRRRACWTCPRRCSRWRSKLRRRCRRSSLWCTLWSLELIGRLYLPMSQKSAH